MARVTVEDCLKNVKNRFELVIVAAKRARQLMRGKEPKVEWDNDKPTVVALREVAAGYTDVDQPDHHEEIIPPIQRPAPQVAHDHDDDDADEVMLDEEVKDESEGDAAADKYNRTDEE